MKLKLGFLAALAFAMPAFGQDINRIQILSQEEFRLLSEDLGGALSYKAQTPTEPLGLTGFDIGIGLTAAKLKNTAVFQRATSDNVDTLPVPTIRAHKGLPLGIDVGLMYAAIPGSNIKYTGGELRWAFVPGNTVLPAVGVRGSFTKVSGVEQLDFNTRGLDFSLSKGFAFFTPYAGLGRVWVESDPKGNGGLSREEFTLPKRFIGVGMNFALLNLNLEADRTGDVTGYSIKAGLRF
jgi:hypothetical protein